MRKKHATAILYLLLYTTPSYTVVPGNPFGLLPLCIPSASEIAHEIAIGSGKVLYTCGAALYGLLPSLQKVIEGATTQALAVSLIYLACRVIKKYGPRTQDELLLDAEFKRQEDLKNHQSKLEKLKLNTNALQRLKNDTSKLALDLSQNLISTL